MSPKKIIFFSILGVLLLVFIGAALYLSSKDEKVPTTNTPLKIWITEGTSDSYNSLIEGFKKYAPEYANTEIIVEKQVSNPDRYRTLILSTLTDSSGPDIFMLRSGEDTILEDKIALIPSSVLDFSDFDKRYDDLFSWLLVWSGAWKDKQISLKWVPLVYETLGVFYNKSLIRTVPKTWIELENLYKGSITGIYPSNLGLGPTYVPNMVDIIPIWLRDAGARDYSGVGGANEWLSEYLSYGDISVGSGEELSIDKKSMSLSTEKTRMIQTKNNTLDMFMQWDIGLIVWYPSLILELEKSAKRAGQSSVEDIILTDRIPQISSQVRENIGRYNYYAISKQTSNGALALKFMAYLMTSEAERLYIEEYPYLIPAQTEFYDTIRDNSLSNTLNRTRLDAFIPDLLERVSVFDYGLKSRFEEYLQEGIDRENSIDIDGMATKISLEIACELQSSRWEWESSNCQSK